MLEDLRDAVAEANRELVRQGLVTLTWGNVSGFDRASGLVAIKPSGVPYDDLTGDTIVLVDLDGRIAKGRLRPSSDVLTHLFIYRAFETVGGITHTHSPKATAFAQARREIPCLGTTHADHFRGPVPVTRPLNPVEVEDGYEQNTGAVIVERFQDLSPEDTPAVLVAGHAPFSWGRDAEESVRNAVALEAVAAMALDTLRLTNDVPLLEEHILRKHHERKHGPEAYYGQPAAT